MDMRAEPKGSGFSRIEALEGQSVCMHGALLLAPPLTHRVFSLVAAIVAATVAALFCVGTYTARTQASGIVALVRGAIRITSPSPISDQRVPDEPGVFEGQVLFILTDNRSLDAGRQIVDKLAPSSREEQRNLENRRGTILEIAQEQETPVNGRSSSSIESQQQVSPEITTHSRHIDVAETAQS